MTSKHTIKKYSQKPKIVVSQELKTELDKLGSKNDTYDSIIWKLLGKISPVILKQNSDLGTTKEEGIAIEV